MRPRKDVIVYCANELHLSLVTVPLDVRLGCNVIKASTVEEVRQAILDSKVEGCVVVIRTPGDEANLLDIKIPSIEVLCSKEEPVVLGSRILLHHPASFAAIIDAVRMANSRKRGPKRKLAA